MKASGPISKLRVRRQFSGLRTDQGFTLVETLTTLFILGVLTALLGVSFVGLIPRLRLEHAVWEVNAHLNYARTAAVFHQTRSRFSILGEFICVERYLEAAKQWKIERLNLITGVSLRSNNRPVFYPNGNVGGWASIRIVNAAGAYKITLAISGRIKIAQME